MAIVSSVLLPGDVSLYGGHCHKTINFFWLGVLKIVNFGKGLLSN
jgi:hypothetical protein